MANKYQNDVDEHFLGMTRNNERKMDAMFEQLQNKYSGSGHVNSRDLKIMVFMTLNGVRDDVMSLLTDSNGSANSWNLESLEPSNENPDQVITGQLAMKESFNRTLDEIQSVRRKDRADPQSALVRDSPGVTEEVIAASPEVDVSDTTDPQPSDARASCIMRMLRYMAGKLRDFFGWLKTKVADLASRAWQAVKNAFRSMYNWLASLGKPHRS